MSTFAKARRSARTNVVGTHTSFRPAWSLLVWAAPLLLLAGHFGGRLLADERDHSANERVVKAAKQREPERAPVPLLTRTVLDMGDGASDTTSVEDRSASLAEDDRYSEAARLQRAQKNEAFISERIAEISHEPRDPNWALESEQALEARINDLRARLGAEHGIEVQAIRCGSSRCAVEGHTTHDSSATAMVTDLQGVSGLLRTYIRKSIVADGFQVRAVLARPGYEITGEKREQGPIVH